MGSIIKLTRWSLQSEVHIYFFDTGCETFFGTKFFRDRFRDFFRYQIFSRPVPGLFSVPNFFETGSETFFGTKFFRDRFRYHQKNWRIPGNGNSRDRDVTLLLKVYSILFFLPLKGIVSGPCIVGQAEPVAVGQGSNFNPTQLSNLLTSRRWKTTLIGNKM